MGSGEGERVSVPPKRGRQTRRNAWIVASGAWSRGSIRATCSRAASAVSVVTEVRTTSSRSDWPSRSKKTEAGDLAVGPELAEEAEALAGGQDIVALEERHLDLAERQVLGGVGEDRGSRLQRHRPALQEGAAGVGRADDLDEAVVAGGGRDEAGGEGAVGLRLRRVRRAVRQEVAEEEAEDLAAARASAADVLGEPLRARRRAAASPPAARAPGSPEPARRRRAARRALRCRTNGRRPAAASTRRSSGRSGRPA